MRIAWTLILLLTPSPVFPGPLTEKPTDREAKLKRLDVRVNHLIDLSYMIRKYAGSKSEPPKGIDGFGEAVALARRLNAEFGWVGPTWSVVDIALARCRNASEAAQALSQLPEVVTSRKGDKIRVREAAVRYAKALGAAEASYLEAVWPRHRAAVEGAAANVARNFTPKEQECFAYFTRNLGMEDVQSQLPVYLVAESPWPGGFTLWTGDRRMIVISVEAHQGSTLFETLLHEAIHALDLETKGKGNVLAEIHGRLLKAGLTDDDQAVRHGAHWLVFIQAGKTIRRLIDPSHRHYGTELYARLQRMSKADVPAVWASYLDGKISRGEAVSQVTDGFLKARSETTSPKAQ